VAVRQGPPTLIVLASGRGERFRASGGATHKLDALLRGKTVLQHVLDTASASGLPWHLERAGHATMGDSIAAAVRATREAPGWLILPGDLPLVTPTSLLAVARALQVAQVAAPRHGSRPGHPVGFAAALLDELLQLGGKDGAKGIVQAAQQRGLWTEIELDDIGTVFDIDTVEQLALAEELLARRAHAPH
jgi:molybdenum cofactor cytidylyltransferase